MIEHLITEGGGGMLLTFLKNEIYYFTENVHLLVRVSPVNTELN
jgi:hypothetical protein